MPVVVGINSRESGQPVALTSGTLVTSQSGLNVVIQSGAFITNDSGVRVVIQSGAPVSLQSGLPVNIGSGIGVVAASGLFVITDSGQRVVIQSGAPVSLQSGLPVNIGSGVGVLIQSGINVNVGSGVGVVAASGLFIINDSGVRVVIQSGATVSLQSGTFVNVGLVSGLILGSGLAYQMSGANVIATVSVGSGLSVITATSGQGFPVVGGQYQPVDPVIASGQNWPLRVSADGDLRVYIDVRDASGINVVISGQPVYISGTVALLSGGYVNLGSNTVVSIGSGIAYQMSGANVIASVSIGSGLGVVQASGVIMIQSGQPVAMTIIAGQYRPEYSGAVTVLASGMYSAPSLSIDGDLRVEIDPKDSSGLLVIIQSGAPISFQSGSYVNIGSGVGVQLNPAYISGTFVQTTSGSPVWISSMSGENFRNSGLNVIAGTSIASQVTMGQGFWFMVTGISGGIVLSSGSVKGVSVKALATNKGLILVGGSGTGGRPFFVSGAYVTLSGAAIGLPLAPGETISLEVGSLQAVYVCAELSGDYVSYVGVN